nr:polysaccharide pyruvyl transferase family protein [Agromyces bauzanensis]
MGIDRIQSMVELMRRHSLHPTATARRLYSGNSVTVVGADTVGGDYEHRFLAHRVAALNESAASGHRVQLVNFSISAEPTPLALSLLRRLDSGVELHARDVNSQRRAQGFLQREVGVAPDVGALLECARVEQHAAEYCVLVPNAHLATHFEFSESDLVDSWSDLATWLGRKMKVFLLPHDLREHPGDLALVNRIAERVNLDSVRPWVVADAREAKGVISRAVLLISARMHACVAALSSAVPTVGISYLGKFEGQFEWFDVPRVVVPFERATDTALIKRLAEQLLNERNVRGSQLKLGDFGWL